MKNFDVKDMPPQSDSSLLKIYNDLNPESIISSIKTMSETPPLEPSKMLEYLNRKAKDLGLRKIKFIEKKFIPHNWQEMDKEHREYLRNRAIFLKMIGYSNSDECVQIGMNKKDLELLKRGITPENFNTHIKIPFDFGGTNDISNLSLVKSHPSHDYIHKLIETQIANDFLRVNKKIFIPFFEGKIYHD